MTPYLEKQLQHKHTRELYEKVFSVAKASNYKKAMEIGCAWAITTLAILRAGTGHLMTIDKAVYENTIKEVKAFGLNYRWQYVIEASEDVMPILIDRKYKFDLICIDGDHRYEYVKRDIENAKQLLNPKGVIIVDDYYHKKNDDGSADQYGVKRAVDELLPNKKIYKKANGICVASL